ncbi:MAG: metal-sulfur cluster assembly factor [Chloroflexota bacterium]
MTVSGTEQRLMLALHDVQDPELPISIVDMGLIVDLHYSYGVVDIKITFTAMGCPAVDMIMDDVRERLLAEPDVESVRLEIVWHPIWTKDRLSEEGKERMRECGISV